MSESSTNLQEDKYLRPLILDMGYSTFRFGWSGSDTPEITIPSIFTKPNDFLFRSDVIEGIAEIISAEQKKLLFGEDAERYKNILNIQRFEEKVNSPLFKDFFLKQYEKLDIPKDFRFMQPIVIICSYNLTEIEKKEYKDLFFNQLNFPFLLFLPSDKAILSTLNTVDGIIVDMGAKNIYISSVYHGFINPTAKEILPIGGFHLTKYFLDLILKRKSIDEKFFFNIWMAQELKEDLAICVLKPSEEKTKIKNGLTKYDQSITLPNQNQFIINYERFMLVEPLFDPTLINLDYENLINKIVKSIKFWERENWQDLISNIILTGGTSKISGLKKRLTMEIKKHFSDALKPKINVITPKDRVIIAWVGASLLSAQDKLEKWIKNPSYQ
ncbi:MAG: hypothetical protein EU547_02100 [Promethearchaeota archaeon]|nr:MAG: hypothetical protein EU547_02100 [Candidatus Lokiarchaeota archaeon]